MFNKKTYKLFVEGFRGGESKVTRRNKRVAKLFEGVGVESCEGMGSGGGSGDERFALTSHAAVHLYLSVKVMVKCGSQFGSYMPL
jgi:hypothetical protein